MRTLAAVVLSLIAIAPSAAAQTTEDAVKALLRGDYRQAAAILRPLAETAGTPDPVAQFYLATLYDNGLGVAFDPMRACALYLRSMEPANPFLRQAEALAQALQTRLPPDMARTCVMMAAHGFRDALDPPLTFTLGPGHWITVGRFGVTVEYAGKETHDMMDFGGVNAVLLKPRFTELKTGADRNTRRYFIEFFAWLPSRSGNLNGWTLGWNVFEIVRDHIEIFTGDDDVAEIATLEAPAEFDVSRAVRLGTTETGDVEWEILSGPHAKRVVPPPPETPEQKAARTAPPARVPRTAAPEILDPLRQPAMQYPNVEGCGAIAIYGWSADWTEVLAIDAKKDALHLSTEPRTFDVAAVSNALAVTIHVYSAPFHGLPFCTDVVTPTAPAETWTARAGRVTIQLSPPGILRDTPSRYRATVRLEDLEFVSPSGARARLATPLVFTAIVGTFFG